HGRRRADSLGAAAGARCAPGGDRRRTGGDPHDPPRHDLARGLRARGSPGVGSGARASAGVDRRARRVALDESGTGPALVYLLSLCKGASSSWWRRSSSEIAASSSFDIRFLMASIGLTTKKKTAAAIATNVITAVMNEP